MDQSSLAPKKTLPYFKKAPLKNENCGKKVPGPILHAVYYMLKEGISRHVLTMDLKLHTLLERGKVAAGKSISNLLAVPDNIEGLSCRYVDPARAYYDPREVEFSCSSTPFHVAKRRSRQHRCCYDYRDHAATVARAFEILSGDNDDYQSPLVVSTVVRQVRVTDSPFPLVEEGKKGSCVDKEAEEFIKRFYAQLRLQNKAQ